MGKDHEKPKEVGLKLDSFKFTAKEVVYILGLLVAILGTWYDTKATVTIMQSDIKYLQRDVSEIRTTQANRHAEYEERFKEKGWALRPGP